MYTYDRRQDLDVKRVLNYDLPFEVADCVLDKLFSSHIGDEVAFAQQLYVNTDRVQEMASAGMTFGAHSENHRVLSRLTVDEQRLELKAGITQIRRLTGQRSVPFCYPYGHTHTYNRETIAILSEYEYSLAFNVTRGAVRLGQDSRYELPRFDTRDLPPFTEISVHA